MAAQNNIPLVHAWGGGEVASADGLRFVVLIRTIHAGPNPKYFGYERGVTYYNLVSDQFTGLNANRTVWRRPSALLFECFVPARAQGLLERRARREGLGRLCS